MRPHPIIRPILVAWMAVVLFPSLVPTACLGATASDPAPPQGAALLKTDILGVFAHPDDETGMASTIAHLALGEGRVIAHVYATRGEGGGNMVGTQAGPALGILREAELRDCLHTLGVRSCYFLDQEDFFYTESLAATLRKWRRDEALEKLVRYIRALRPEIILTMNPAPNAGQHGHHQAAGVLAIEAFAAAADPQRYPLQLSREGLRPWQPRKLFYGGASGPHLVSIVTTNPLPDGRLPADVAARALSHHRSQAFGNFAASPWMRRPQSFVLARSVVAPVTDAADLFAGLPAPEPVRVLTFDPAEPPPPFRFAPRPAIVAYQAWAAQNGITHLAGSFPADLPVVAGESNTLILVLDPGSTKALEGNPTLALPPGWMAAAPTTLPGAPHQLRYGVTPPPDAMGDFTITAQGRIGNTEHRASARLHAVPGARVPRLRHPPQLDGSEAGWREAATLVIGTNRTWQGTAESPADLSAIARIAHHDDHLWVSVDVSDDVVVSNIAPDDIKGHWRSDSVEICIDPQAGAADTTGCLKIGIFPFDSSGRVRAARDADARPGPAEETAPGLRLASRRLETGYRVQVAIPFSLLPDLPQPPRRLGFNVLVYDGDKAGAAPGENINECRIAWAPRSGVQGRPEDWGRVDLESP